MADECSFCAERCSTAIIRDDMIFAHTDCKEMNLCPIRAFFFFKKRHPFLTNLPQSQIRLVYLLLLDEKVARSPCGSAILEKSL